MPNAATEFVKVMDEITDLRDQIDKLLPKRDRLMVRLREEGLSYESISKLAGPGITHVGVFRALQRREARDVAAAEAAAQ
jgi:hypothetical protein